MASAALFTSSSEMRDQHEAVQNINCELLTHTHTHMYTHTHTHTHTTHTHTHKHIHTHTQTHTHMHITSSDHNEMQFGLPTHFECEVLWSLAKLLTDLK